MKNKAKKVLKIIRSVFFWLCIVVLVVAVIAFLSAKIRNTQPSVFGYSIYRVSSGSMEPELLVGDVILSKAVSDPMEIQVGDVVTYKGSGMMTGSLITHEVIVAPCQEDGKLMLQTKGIANDIPDEPIEADRIVSVMICKISLLRGFYNFFFSPWGLLTIIGLVIFIFIDELIVFIKTAMGHKSPKESKSIDDIIGRLQSENPQQADGDEENADSSGSV